MSGIGFDPEARTEFLGAVKHYEECRKGLGRRFREAVETQFATGADSADAISLSSSPSTFQMLSGADLSILNHLLDRAGLHLDHRSGTCQKETRVLASAR